MLSDSDEELDALIKKAVHQGQTTNGDTSTSKGSWACPHCTFLNHKDLIECEMCNKPRKLTKKENGDLKSKLGVGARKAPASKGKVSLGKQIC